MQIRPSQSLQTIDFVTSQLCTTDDKQHCLSRPAPEYQIIYKTPRRQLTSAKTNAAAAGRLNHWTTYRRFRQSSPHRVGTVNVSRATDEGLNGRLIANRNLVSISSVCVESCRDFSFSWILRMKLTGTRSSNSFTGVYKFKIFIIWKRQNNTNDQSETYLTPTVTDCSIKTWLITA